MPMPAALFTTGRVFLGGEVQLRAWIHTRFKYNAEAAKKDVHRPTKSSRSIPPVFISEMPI